MSIRSHVLAGVIISVFIAAVAMAATDRGSIRGHVGDTSRNSLPGAVIHVEPGSLTVITDREGFFTVTDLEPGTYTVEVSYVGFLPEKQDVRVGSGSTPASVDVKLNLAPSVADEITVSASRPRGEVQALNQRRSAVNIVDVLPAEVISSLPNANVAEALARLPSVSVERDEGEPKFVQIRGLEPRFASVTINGVQIPSTQSGVRQIKLDAFPSDLVGAIELHKTISADQDGDAIGGSVNLVTKTAGDETSYNVSGEGGYESLQGGRPSSRASATYTSRFGADRALGLVFGGTYDFNGRAINDIEPGPAVVQLPDGTPQSVFTATDLRDYRYARKRFGFAGGLDYRMPNNSSLYMSGFMSQFQNYGDRWVTSIS
ncbi:MAG: TonB-dependent receptor plug domain-containing protein, partial [Thermoanaerobaculia bacterium]